MLPQPARRLEREISHAAWPRLFLPDDACRMMLWQGKSHAGLTRPESSSAPVRLKRGKTTAGSREPAGTDCEILPLVNGAV